MTAVIGGDKRFIHLVKILEANGFPASGFMQGGAGLEPDSLARFSFVVLPFPLGDASGMLNAPFCPHKIPLDELAKIIPDSAAILSGGVLSGRRCFDYSHAVKTGNGILTAQAAIARYISLSDTAVWGSKAVVIGYGAIAKPLCAALFALGASVTAVARSPQSRAEAQAAGCATADFTDIASALGKADVVFNTVPAPCIGVRELQALPREAVIIELASAPYGVDLIAAHGLGRYVEIASGLPGRISPYSAAKVIFEAVKPYLKGEKR